MTLFKQYLNKISICFITILPLFIVGCGAGNGEGLDDQGRPIDESTINAPESDIPLLPPQK